MAFSLWISMDLQHLLGQGRGGAESAPPAAAVRPRSAIAARVVVSHRRDETDAEADRGASAAASAVRREHDAAAGEAAAELVARPGQPAAERAAGPSEPLGRLVEGEALEVAEHDRQAEGPRQSVDLAVQGLGLLAVDHRARPGRRDADSGRLDGARLPRLATAGEPAPGLPGRAERHAVEPVAQQVGVADRPGLAGQDEEDGLEGVLGMVVVAQELPADAQDHRPVARHQGGEGGLAGRLAAGGEPLEELAVGEPGDRAALEERPELPDQRWRGHIGHA